MAGRAAVGPEVDRQEWIGAARLEGDRCDAERIGRIGMSSTG